MAADDPDIAADRAQVLVATALAVGPERAASAALAALGPDALAQVLPLLQPAAVERPTRHAIGDQDWDLDDLRKACAEAAGVEVPKLAQLRRVSLRSVGVVVLVGLVAYAIISALADVGLANLIDEFKAADLAWLAVALALSPVVPMGKAFATLGASFRPLRYGPVLMLEYAIQFIALAVPSSAARLALDIRFFGRNGIDAGAAISISAIDQRLRVRRPGPAHRGDRPVGAGVSAAGGSGASSTASTGGSSSSDGSPLLLLTAVLVVAGVIVILAVPKYRTAVTQAVPRYRAMLGSQASSAATALRVLRSPPEGRDDLRRQPGSTAAPGRHPRALPAGLRPPRHHGRADPGEHHRDLLAGFMPVPGGMGVAEAAYTAGLVALGVPSAAAVSTAIAFRMVTYYLPPIWGAIAMRWLRQHAYL